MTAIADFLLAYGPAMPFGEDPWWTGWTLFLLAGALYMGVRIGRSIGLTAGLCVFWTLISGIRIFAVKSTYAELGAATAMAMDNVALSSTLGFAMIVLVLGSMNEKSLEFLEERIAGICLVNSLMVLIEAWYGAPPAGLLGNPSMNGVFIAVSYPLLAMKQERNDYIHLKLKDSVRLHSVRILWDIICFTIPIIAVFASGQSVPVATLLVVWTVYLLFSHDAGVRLNTLGKKLSVTVSMLGVGIAVAIWKVPNLMHDSGRIAIWRESLRWWLENANFMVGTGAGTYFMWGPHIQQATNVSVGNWFIWAHCDPLQLLFEYGFIGIMLYGWFFLETLIICHLSKTAYRTAALTGLLAASFLNFPFHLAATALLGALLCIRMRRQIPSDDDN